MLIIGLNWLGDAIMSMPALQLFRDQHPDWRITMLVKPPLVSLWEMHEAVDVIEILEPGTRGVYTTGRRLTGELFDRAYILPNSFRSALVPWLGGIRQRIGVRGQFRGYTINRPIRFAADVDHQHQQFEIFTLLGMALPPEGPPLPALKIPPAELIKAEQLLPAGPAPRIGCIPGAARGSSKQWPEAHFISLIRQMLDESDTRVALLGTASDHVLCERIATSLDAADRVVNLAGTTSLKTFTALLSLLNGVVANDSGGMHLAAAVGTPLVALYGITDPGKTGPLGPHARVLQKSETRSRDVPRVSAEAEAALASILPEEVWEAMKGSLRL
ncbi:MAG: heptosyltransferase-2 [Kiritimatiellia bacterium]